MPHSAFDNPTYDRSRRRLTVGGPLETDGVVLGPVSVRFLLIQEAPRESGEETGGGPLILHGSGSSSPDATSWEGHVDLTDDEDLRLRPDEIRGIAAAVMVRPAVVQQPAPNPPPPHPDPPFVDTFAWCVSRTVVF